MPPPELLDRAIAFHSTPFLGDGFHPEAKQAYLRRVPPFDRRFPPPPACRPQRTGSRQSCLLRKDCLDVVPPHPPVEPHPPIGKAHVLTPLTSLSRMPPSACEKKT